MLPADRQIAFLLYDSPDNIAQVKVVKSTMKELQLRNNEK